VPNIPSPPPPSRVRANDEPHGVFSLDPVRQSVGVAGSGPDLARFLVLNVTRGAGLFGNASVGYRITGGPDVQALLGGGATGRVLLVEGESSASVTLSLSNQVRRPPPTRHPSRDGMTLSTTTTNIMQSC